MAEELDLPWLILSVIGAFVAGMLILHVYLWLLPIIKRSRGQENGKMGEREWLEYYEKQFIDMKIRLDTLELQGKKVVNDGSRNNVVGSPDVAGELIRLLTTVMDEGTRKEPEEKEPRQVSPPKETSQTTKESKSQDSVPTVDSVVQQNPTDRVLQLITNNITTSRDLQITLKKSREHTARLLKKMFEDGYLQRDQGGRPYTYSLTPKGEARLQGLHNSSTSQSVL